jgi:hypothetical protein
MIGVIEDDNWRVILQAGILRCTASAIEFKLCYFVTPVHARQQGFDMCSEKLIEITQDAACVIRKDKEGTIGFFTDNVQTCLIYIITTEVATIAIHDSGQLCIERLSTFIRSHGEVCSIALVHGIDLDEVNKKRLPNLLSMIGYSKKPDTSRSKFNIFSVAYEVNSGISIYPNTRPENVYGMPNKDTVQTIVELNNNFIPLNSQSLPLDVQFYEEDYCNNSRLLFSLDEMLKICDAQPKYIETNHRFLRKGHMAGLFTLPKDFLQ